MCHAQLPITLVKTLMVNWLEWLKDLWPMASHKSHQESPSHSDLSLYASLEKLTLCVVMEHYQWKEDSFRQPLRTERSASLSTVQTCTQLSPTQQ